MGDIMDKISAGPELRPPNYLLKMFSSYLKSEEENPSTASEIGFEEFGTHWLALFNYAAHKDQSNIPIWDWVDKVALSPYRPVKLMRYINGSYQQIALIPPLFDNFAPILKPDGEKDTFMQLAVKEAARYTSANKAAAGNGFLQRNIKNKFDLTKKALSDHFFKMNDIFKLYNVERTIPDWLKDDPRVQNMNGEPSKEVTTSTSTLPPSFYDEMEEE